MTLRRVTLWYKYNTKTKQFDYNHLQNGWSNIKYPLPFNEKFVNQKSWKNYKWKSAFAFLDNGEVKQIGN